MVRYRKRVHRFYYALDPDRAAETFRNRIAMESLYGIPLYGSVEKARKSGNGSCLLAVKVSDTFRKRYVRQEKESIYRCFCSITPAQIEKPVI